LADSGEPLQFVNKPRKRPGKDTHNINLAFRRAPARFSRPLRSGRGGRAGGGMPPLQPNLCL
ncbi:MAG TPA: hypothetical protein VFZ08_02375, partial [Terriglobia bacterium]|nr:hypothetical protein [Terriglobia bacterium]